MTRLRAIGFDLDNTLYDQGQHMRSFFHRAGVELAGALALPAATIEAALVDVWLRRTSYYGRLFDEALEAIGRHDRDTVKQLVALYHDHRSELSLFDGVRDMLVRLRERFSLFLISDGSERMQRGKLESLDLERCFDEIVLTGAHGKDWVKPAEHAFRRVVDRLGGQPREYLYAGDNPACDFVGARRVGMKTARVMTGPFASHPPVSDDHDADVVLAKITDLEAVLHDLEATV